MTPTPADRMLQHLYRAGAVHVGVHELAGALGADSLAVSRAAEELVRRGHTIDRTPAGGLRLVRPARPDPALIEPALAGRRIGRSVLCFDEVDSTNDVAWSAVGDMPADGLVVLAEHQRRGRGRQGRTWLSPPGANVLMSIVLVGESALACEPLTIAAGLAVAEGLSALTGSPLGLKWPNDVLLDGAKLAGVLVEARREPTGTVFVVGMGINVLSAPSSEQAGRPATCLADACGATVERVEVIVAVLKALDGWVGRISAGEFERLRAEWVARCAMINTRIRVRSGEDVLTGRVLDVSPLDGLALLCDDGSRVHVTGATSRILE